MQWNCFYTNRCNNSINFLPNTGVYNNYYVHVYTCHTVTFMMAIKCWMILTLAFMSIPFLRICTLVLWLKQKVSKSRYFLHSFRTVVVTASLDSSHPCTCICRATCTPKNWEWACERGPVLYNDKFPRSKTLWIDKLIRKKLSRIACTQLNACSGCDMLQISRTKLSPFTGS